MGALKAESGSGIGVSIELEIRALHESGISRAKAARTLMISKERMDLYIDAIGLDWKKRVRGGSYVIDGVTDTLNGHSVRLGISVGKLRWRLKHSQPIEAQPTYTTVSRDEAQNYADLRKSGMPAWEAAEKIGRPYNTLNNACKRFFPDYELIISEAPRVRRSIGTNTKTLQIPRDLEVNVRRLCASGISKTRAATMLVINRERLNVIIKALDLEWKPQVRAGAHVIDGIKDSLQGHSVRLGISVGMIRSRLKKQQPLAGPAVYKPIDLAEARRFVEHRKNGLPAWKAAEEVGRPYGSLKDACKRLIPDYEEVVVSAIRVRRTPEEIEAAEVKRAA